jgi:hypothetical protein
MAQSLRQQSMQAQVVTETLTDVNQEAVDDLMTQLRSDLLVHGHTHQPMLHRWRSPPAVDGSAGDSGSAPGAGPERLRWVLSDWAASPPRGEVLPLSTVADPRLTPPAC